MAASQQRPKLIVIVGPTASGKSELALRIAQRFNGEIIAADSRTTYKNVDIGTAKPTKKDRRLVPHWGLDLVEPGQPFAAKQFKDYANQKIKEIRDRGHLAVLVGGTGLYVDSVVFDFRFRPAAAAGRRHELERKSIEELQEEVEAGGYEMPQNRLNRRHLIRVIESGGVIGGRRTNPLPGTMMVGLMPPPALLRQRIDERAENMFKANVLEETQKLIKRYGKDAAKSAGIIYSICADVIGGELGEEEAINLCKIRDWQYSRRQRTWFKRNPYIHWFEDVEIAERYIENRLNN